MVKRRVEGCLVPQTGAVCERSRVSDLFCDLLALSSCGAVELDEPEARHSTRKGRSPIDKRSTALK